MSEIDSLRAEIDQIHQEITALFRKRLFLAHQIWEIKKSQGHDFHDPSREQKIIHQFDSSVADPKEREAIQNFLKALVHESKKTLEDRFK